VFFAVARGFHFSLVPNWHHGKKAFLELAYKQFYSLVPNWHNGENTFFLAFSGCRQPSELPILAATIQAFIVNARHWAMLKFGVL